MIIGLITLFTLLFGGGDLDAFYIDKIEQGVDKYVIDKDRKKEIKVMLEAHEKATKEFTKSRVKQIELLKESNLNKATPENWYKNFFNGQIQEREKRQDQVISQRIELQKKITSEEWSQIMILAANEATEIEVKEKKKEMKDNDHNIFKNLEKSVNENILDEIRLAKSNEILKKFENSYNNVSNSITNIDVNQTHFLADQLATKEQMKQFTEAVNAQREELYASHTDFILQIKKHTTSEEWKSIIKEFNKLLM